MTLPGDTPADQLSTTANQEPTKKGGGISKSLLQSYQIRDHVSKIALECNDPELLAKLVSAHDTLCERIRILRGKPLPGSLRPDKSSMKKGKHVRGMLRDAPQVHDVSIAQLPSANPAALAVIDAQPVNGPSNG